MPQKLNMLLTNNNHSRVVQLLQQQVNRANLATTQTLAAPKAPSSLKAPIISRIHAVRPGCGSCGRH